MVYKDYILNQIQCKKQSQTTLDLLIDKIPESFSEPLAYRLITTNGIIDFLIELDYDRLSYQVKYSRYKYTMREKLYVTYPEHTIVIIEKSLLDFRNEQIDKLL